MQNDEMAAIDFTDSINLLSALHIYCRPQIFHRLPAEGSLFYSTTSTPFCTLAGSAAMPANTAGASHMLNSLAARG